MSLVGLQTKVVNAQMDKDQRWIAPVLAMEL